MSYEIDSLNLLSLSFWGYGGSWNNKSEILTSVYNDQGVLSQQFNQANKNLEKAWEQIDANIESINIDNSVKRQTIETMVQQAQANLQKTMAEILS